MYQHKSGADTKCARKIKEPQCQGDASTLAWFWRLNQNNRGQNKSSEVHPHLQVARHRLHRAVDLGLLGEDAITVPGPRIPALSEVPGDLRRK